MEVKNICVGKNYKNKNGEEKTQWLTIGKLFITEKGMSVQIDAVPTGWDGHAQVFDQKKEGQKSGDGLPF